MSQRLLIGKSEKDNLNVYEVVITRETDKERIVDIIKTDFFKYRPAEDKDFLGPWKIRINDVELFKEIWPKIQKCFRFFGKKFPEDVWCFFLNDKKIEHPTKRELLLFIDN